LPEQPIGRNGEKQEIINRLSTGTNNEETMIIAIYGLGVCKRRRRRRRRPAPPRRRRSRGRAGGGAGPAEAVHGSRRHQERRVHHRRAAIFVEPATPTPSTHDPSFDQEDAGDTDFNPGFDNYRAGAMSLPTM